MNYFGHRGVTVRTTMMAVATGVALSLTGASALAERGGPHKMHEGGGGGIDHMISGMLAHAKERLNLNTSQQQIFDNAVAQSKAAHETARASRQQVKDALNAELAKPEPNLAAVASVADGVEQQNRTLRQNVRSTWLQLYASLSPDQKGIVREMLATRLQRAENAREGFRERFRDRAQANRPPQ